jgi:predicted DNA-binding transcriptional regulator AlpA
MQKLLPLKVVVNLTPYSKSTIWLKVGRGEFPKPLTIPGVRGAHWLASEVEAHLNAIVAAARGTRPEAPTDGGA